MKSSITVLASWIFSCAVFTKDSAQDCHFPQCPSTHKPSPKTRKTHKRIGVSVRQRLKGFSSIPPITRLSFKIKGDLGITIFQSPELIVIGKRDYVYPKNVKKFMSKKYLKSHTHKKHEPFIFR